ncbi:MAG: hypothetical protein ACFFCW_25720, partial [Candidatus Hodarchaeota archaeon]
PEEKNLQEVLEKMLEEGRKTISDSGIVINIESTESDAFTMTMSDIKRNFTFPEKVSGSCYPITIPEKRAQEIGQLKEMGKIEFRDLTPEALTGFIAFRLLAKEGGEKAGISFVLNLPVKGMPEDRDKRILLNILSNQETFIRYLLLILGGEDGVGMNKPTGTGSGISRSSGGHLLPLFEEMVRAFSRDPVKIDRIAEIMDDLKVSGNLDEILPPGFYEMWKAFREERV